MESLLLLVAFIFYEQMKGLSELDEKLTSIQSDHSVLAQSLDSTLHELPTKHVIITNEGKKSLVYLQKICQRFCCTCLNFSSRHVQ